jgi:hypothetical protein
MELQTPTDAEIDLGGVVRVVWKLAQFRVCVSWDSGKFELGFCEALQQGGTTVVDSPGVVWTIWPPLKYPLPRQCANFHAVRFRLRLS